MNATNQVWKVQSIQWPSPQHLSQIIAQHPNSIWLDSALTSHHDSKISLLGLAPIAQVSFFYHDIAKVLINNNTQTLTHQAAQQWMDDYLKQQQITNFTFAPAWMGYINYEFAYPLHSFQHKPSNTTLPLAQFVFPGIYLWKDHIHNISQMIYHESLESTANEIFNRRGGVAPPIDCGRGYRAPTVKHDLPKETYIQNIEDIRNRIARGDCYQVNYSERFYFSTDMLPEDYYLKLREQSPAPFMAFANFNENYILSASPECFLRFHQTTILTRPIKGTRPRSADPMEDEHLKNELKNSEKDAAELLMIVDLMRNDLGKISQPGSVEVACLKKAESFSHVHHLVATITATLLPNISPLQAVMACFPPGSITGAPKHKAMEIIQELETSPRGIYTGAIGFISASGEAVFNVAIRTALFHQQQLVLGSGGGIVFDSHPESEFEEILIKAKNFLQLLG